MKRYRIPALLLALVLLCSGCQLAQPEPETAAASRDMLVGIYLTPEHLDLFDIEAYLNDNFRLDGGEIVVDGDTSAYEGRLYATLVDDRWAFHTPEGEPLEGYFFLSTQISIDGDVCNVMQGDLSDGKYDVKYGDHEQETNITGTLFVQSAPLIQWYFNPVYQTEDGQVYLTAGQGTSMGGDNGVGMSYTHSGDHEITYPDENGEAFTERFHYSVRVEVQEPAALHRLVWMDATHQVLRREEYAILPDTLEAQGAAYLIVEEIMADGTSTLALYQPEEHNPVYVRTLVPADFDTLQAKDIPVNWE